MTLYASLNVMYMLYHQTDDSLFINILNSHTHTHRDTDTHTHIYNQTSYIQSRVPFVGVFCALGYPWNLNLLFPLEKDSMNLCFLFSKLYTYVYLYFSVIWNNLITLYLYIHNRKTVLVQYIIHSKGSNINPFTNQRIFSMVYVSICPSHPQRTGCDTRSIFKRSKGILSTEF